MRTGAVHSTELFEVSPTVAAIGRNHHISMADSEEEFRDRVRVFLDTEFPGRSDGFVDHVTNLAWDAFTGSRLRLEISPAAVALLTALAGTLSPGPGVADLQDSVAEVAARLGWQADTTNVAPPAH